MSESNADRLRGMFERFWKEGDPNAGRGVLAPDIEWHAVEFADLGGTWKGARAVGDFFTAWLDAWDDYDNDVEVFEVTPDILASRSAFRGRGKGSGIEFTGEVGQVWEFKDGLVVRQTMYRTYDEARAAAEQLARGDGA